MIWNVAFILLWLANRKNKNIKRGWRTFWTVLGVLNLAALAWNVLVFWAILWQV